MMLETIDTKFTFAMSLIAGGLAGTSVDIILHPLDTLKTRLQSKQGFAKSGGFSNLYKGILPVIIGSAPSASLFFVTYEGIKNIMQCRVPEKYHSFLHMGSASLAEMVSCLIRVPVEVIKQRRQVSMLDRQDINLRLLYSCYRSTVLRDMPFSLIQFPMWEYFKKVWSLHVDREILPIESAICGAIAGGISATVTTPLDVIKTRIMLSHGNSNTSKLKILYVLKDVYRDKGFHGLFAGVGPRVMWIIIGGFIFFGTYEKWEACKNLIIARGPDGLIEKFENLTPIWSGHFVASVLWMQGSDFCEQPAIDSSGNILLWNGDIFSGNLAQDNLCDTIVLLNALQSCSSVLSVFQEIQGPYSFIYFQKSTNLLYFGRDVIGRHSLLLKVDTDENILTLTSVASKEVNRIMEIPAIGIFVMNLSNSRVNFTCYPWKEPDLRFTDIIEALETHLGVDIDIEKAILKSDVSTCLHLHPNIKDLEYLENSPCLENSCKILEYLIEDKDILERVNRLLKLLYKAVEVRIKKQPKFCRTCIKLVLEKQDVICNHSKIGILFSGGLDSAILTLIADKYVSQHEPIDLINVAFEKSINTSKKSSANNEKQNMEDQYDVPDRKTGRQTFVELTKICPKRKWNFVEVNISQTELQKYRSSRICNLLYPLCTILDESLGCAVWFASRAKGTIHLNTNVYESPCRVLLLGMGADELFGGYMRHRTILRHKGWDALTQELNIELAGISERNLGRDDRIVSDHGRQSRLPYLDENIVEYVQKLKPWERCYPTDKMPSGLGDKLLLRLVAYKLGFRNTANFPKRAFQFGSRIANGKENAKDISKRL